MTITTPPGGLIGLTDTLLVAEAWDCDDPEPEPEWEDAEDPEFPDAEEVLLAVVGDTVVVWAGDVVVAPAGSEELNRTEGTLRRYHRWEK